MSEEVQVESQEQESTAPSLPEGFTSVDELVTAYNELSKAKSEPEQENTEVSDDQVKSMVEEAGLDFNTFQEEYEAAGKLSEQSYQKLTEAGFPRNIVEAHIQGLQASEQLQMNTIYNLVGGEENLSQLLTWAASNLQAEEIDSYNKLTESGDMSQLSLALNGLKAKYEAQHGSMQITSYSGSQALSQSNIFLSSDDVQEAMADPRYGVNESYTKEVEAKMMRTISARKTR
ncbi:capsid assembly protein [Zooshikella ganghwensis]|uniref:capsid assembly protein n=1 Tax=Zooshikella ganghwensis TaxID=202772 RepID=UPI0003F57FCE|nr:hypothetical protein [Zooshikella ganghwensis]